MLVKVVTLFLLAMVLIGMIGKLLFPSSRSGSARRRGRFCPDCGRPLIGKSCDCKGKA